MLIKAVAVGKGASNVTTTDVIGLRIGPTYAQSIEVMQLYPTSTNIMTLLHNSFMGSTLDPLSNRGLAYVSAGPTLTAGTFLLHLNDESMYESLWIRRNGAEMATTILTRAEYWLLNAPGVMRTDEQVRTLMTRSFDAGSSAAFKIASSLYA